MKKTFKRFLSAFLVLAVVIGSAPLNGFKDIRLPDLFSLRINASASTLSGKLGENIEWTLNEETGELSLAGWGDMTNFHYTYNNGGSVNSPLYSKRNLIKSVTISDDITSIGNYAFFNCVNLKEVTIHDGIRSIGWFAFAYCESLETVIIPEGVSTIDESTFKDCLSLKEVNIADSVKKINYRAFYNCKKLSEVTIGKGLETISEQAFLESNMIKKFTVDSENANFSSDADGVLYNKNKSKLLLYPAGNPRETYIIPNHVKIIGVYAFSYCTFLKEVEITKNVTSILQYAFYSSSLLNVDIPDTVKEIGDYAFSLCPNLKSLSISNNLTNIGNYIFYDCVSLENVVFNDGFTTVGYRMFSSCDVLSEIIFPDSVTTIGEYAFSNCFELKDIVFSENLTEIKKWAFAGCNKLEILVLPNSLTYLGSYAFSTCRGLKEIRLPNKLTKILDCTFEGCSSLEKLTMPTSITYIGKRSFADVENLKDFYYEGTVDDWIKISFKNMDSNPFYHAENEYFNGEPIENIVISGSGWLQPYAFSYCDSLKSVVVEGGIFLNSNVFNGCSNLKTVVINGSEYIANSVFYNCSSLEEIYLTNTIKNIGESSFYGCSKLKDIYFDGTMSEFRSIDGYYRIPTTVTVHYLKEIAFKPVEGTGIVIDDSKSIICGLEEGLENIDKYLITENCTIEYVETDAGFGTGTYINVLDNNGKIYKKYCVIIFGDVTGDGVIDAFDTSVVSSISNFESEQFSYNSPFLLAGDLNGDGIVDIYDLAMMSAATNFDYKIPQTR